MKTKTKYIAQHYCSACDARLSWNTIMDSFGVCPECGSVSDCTIIKHYTRSATVEVKAKRTRPSILQWLVLAMTALTVMFIWASLNWDCPPVKDITNTNSYPTIYSTNVIFMDDTTTNTVEKP